MKDDPENIDELLKRSEAGDAVEEDGGRAVDRLQETTSMPDSQSSAIAAAPRVKRSFYWPSIAIPAAAAIGVVILAMWSVLNPRPVAFVEGVHGSSHTLTVGQRFRTGESVRSEDGAGIMLFDGTRIEMRQGSQLAFERAEDGTRIRLDNGGIIVNASKERTGHLYVQTKDVLVSVVGAVFLVNAEETGSRVAVTEGEVEVQHGVETKKLLPGQQVATNR